MSRKEQLGLLKKVCLGSFPRVYPIVLVRYFFFIAATVLYLQ